jgi:hypothetical protein
MLVVEGRVRAVGTVADVRAQAGQAVEALDARGRTVVPGFNDAHCHPLSFGLDLTMVDLRYPGVRTIADLGARVSEWARATPHQTWIRGAGYDNNKLAERRHPTRAELDRATSDHPVLVHHVSGHMSVANSRALAAGTVDRRTPDPPGGLIKRGSDGEPTGLLLETAQRLVREHVPPPTLRDMREAFRRASERMAREGITSVQDADTGSISSDEVGAWQAASDAGEMRQRASLILSVDHVFPPAPATGPFGLGLRSGLGDERLRIGGVKIYSDGSLIGRTAALGAPFEGEPENTGMLLYPSEGLRRLVGDAHRAGWQVSVHAIGDRAVAEVVDAYAAALAAHPTRDHRHRIEHCGIISPELIERIADLGVIPVTQPRFISELGDGFIRALGRGRIGSCYPLASLVRRGILVAGSSDRPVVNGAPLLGIQDAVVQRTAAGEPYAPEEALTVDEALALFTRNAAFASFEDAEKGTLTPGKLADFTLLADDPGQVPPSEIGSIPVVATFVGGVPIFASSDLQA